jgi:hypothetical protein
MTATCPCCGKPMPDYLLSGHLRCCPKREPMLSAMTPLTRKYFTLLWNAIASNAAASAQFEALVQRAGKGAR